MSKQTSLVSVVIPTYNRARWLPLSIGSVQRQTLTDWELLVVDDGSTDDTQAVVTALASEDPRIRYLCNARGKGVSGARNTGIDAARGEFVAFLDSDDEWFPRHLQRAIDGFAVDFPKVDVVCAEAERRHRSTGELFRGNSLSTPRFGPEHDCRSETVLSGKDVVDTFLDGRMPVEVQTAVVRRHAMGSRIRFPEDLKLGEDGFFFAVLAENGKSFLLRHEPHVILWAHGDNTTAAGGRSMPAEKLIELNDELQRLGERILMTFKMSPRQNRAIRKRMAASRFWDIGYRGFLQQRRYVEARRAFRAALNWDRWNAAFWRTYLLSFVRQALRI